VGVAALRGALGFLTRLPAGGNSGDWNAFRAAPWTFPLVGYVVGVLAALPLFTPLPGAAVAATYVLVLYLVTGVNHADGLADLGDAAAVHGAERRLAALKDSDLGVGGTLALVTVVVGLAFTVASVAGVSVYAAVGVVVAAEVGAKLGMALLACVGGPAHEGLGSEFTENDPGDVAIPALFAAPVLALGTPGIAVVGGPLVAFGLRGWTRQWLGGVSGDVFGAANELGRLVGLLLGVMAWTVW
jgi:adenosylcobinamide-GDP ribazoletransferase